jgi:hypothetical protein
MFIRNRPLRTAWMSDVPAMTESMFNTVTDPLKAAGIGDPAGMGDLDPTALVAVVESAHRLESVLLARRFTAMAALPWYRATAAERADTEHGYAVVDGFELAAAMNLSPMAASTTAVDRYRSACLRC